MKKLYRKGTVHPSPPLVSDHLSFLPATILTLAVALTPQDREVLAYLISCSSSASFDNHHRKSSSKYSNGNTNSNSSSISTTAAAASSSTRLSTGHPASFNCNCFGCYMSYWVRWDSSPNRQLIHEILDAFEDGSWVQNKKEKSSRKERKKNKGSAGSVKSHGGQMNSSELAIPDEGFAESEDSSREVLIGEVDGGGSGGHGNGEMKDEEVEKGTSVRRFVGFLGEKIWGIWS